MFTDAPPRNQNRAEYLKSDRIKTLALPHNSALPNVAKDLEAAMKVDNIRNVRKTYMQGQLLKHRVTLITRRTIMPSGLPLLSLKEFPDHRWSVWFLGRRT